MEYVRWYARKPPTGGTNTCYLELRYNMAPKRSTPNKKTNFMYCNTVLLFFVGRIIVPTTWEREAKCF